MNVTSDANAGGHPSATLREGSGHRCQLKGGLFPKFAVLLALLLGETGPETALPQRAAPTTASAGGLAGLAGDVDGLSSIN